MKRILGILSLCTILFSGCSVLSKVSEVATGSASRTYTFQSLPKTVDDITSLKEADLKDPYAVAALTLLSLTRYGDSQADCYEMLNYLKGPEPLSAYEKQFLRDRLQGKTYKPISYFKGTSPSNNYTPTRPYTITVSSNPYSFQEDGWAVMHVNSSGADNARQIKLRQKKSTGQWFLNDIQCLSDIRLPAGEDKWN